MNEEQIAQKLQNDMRRREQEQDVQPTSTEPTTPEPRGFVDDVGDNTNIYRLYDYFNIEPSFRNGENEQRLQTIYRWAANKAGSTDYLEVANVLTSYAQGMGAGSLEKSNLNRIYEFVKLDGQIEHLRQEQGLLYG